MKEIYHKSVLVNEVLHYLEPKPGKIYIDVTFGGGGHTKAILEKEPNCSVVAIDWDKNSIELNGPILQEKFKDRLVLIWGNFGQLNKLLKKNKIESVDGILADFGTSQFQISQAAGFSVYNDTELDMRMSPSHQKLTAREIINKFSPKELESIFFEYGEESHTKKIVKAIVQAREKERIRTTQQLVNIIENVVHKNPRKKIHPATKVFQALRIYVNDELGNIKSFLSASLDILNPGGRLVCISFHSLEDRLVKYFFKDHPCKYKKGFKILTKKIVEATLEEVRQNASSRSAKLRAAEVCLPELTQ